MPSHLPFSSKLLCAAVALLSSLSAPLVWAQTQPASAAPAPTAAEQPAPLTFNIGATTDYRYRGISQSRLKPALQGGVDYTLAGFYVGAWASTIQWLKDAGARSPLELDLYGGYKGEITKDLTYDVGVLRYQYPRYRSVAAIVSPHTLELYGALTYSVATLKYSHSTTNVFGIPDSKGSGYLDLTATFDVGGGFSVVPHVGHQRVTGAFSKAASYTDFSVGVSKDFSGAVVALALVGTNADKNFYVSPSGKALGKTGATLGVKYTF
jgi:uncharacterized protein (TIGR02001 family)